MNNTNKSYCIENTIVTEVERKRYHGLFTAHFLVAHGPLTVLSYLGINIYKKRYYNLRQADFSIPRYETVTYGKHSIRYLGPRLWTKLPKSIRDVTTLTSFKSKIRQLNISELLDDGCAGCSLCSF